MESPAPGRGQQRPPPPPSPPSNFAVAATAAIHTEEVPVAADTFTASSDDIRDGHLVPMTLTSQDAPLQHKLPHRHSLALQHQDDNYHHHRGLGFHAATNSFTSSRSSASTSPVATSSPATASAAALVASSVSSTPPAAPGSPAANRSAIQSLPTPTSPLRTPIKRKPLSSSSAALSLTPTTSLALRNGEHRPTPAPLTVEPLEAPDRRFARRQSVDSPTFYEFPAPVGASEAVASQLTFNAPASDNAEASETRSIPAQDPYRASDADLSDVLSAYDDLASQRSDKLRPEQAVHAELPHGDSGDIVESLYAPELSSSPSAAGAEAPPMFAPKPTPPHLKLDSPPSKADTSGLEFNTQSGTAVPSKLEASPPLGKLTPKSPSQTSPFATLFGWANSSPVATGSDLSPIPSPASTNRKLSANDAPQGLGITRSTSTNSNAVTANPISYCESYLSTPPPGSGATSLQIDEMEDELKAISSELAASIRREMDLEDLVDRLQEQVNNPQAPGKRSSDYFSDSGYSSAKVSEYDQSREEIEKVQRRSEQEKASIRVELSDKLQDERSKRRALDQQIKALSEKASQMDLAHMNNLDANDRVRELEKSCEDLRRRLSEERDSKSNFEDLLSGLKSELQEACNERDNLRDEVVPQLRARVEGLEAEASSYATLTYESTKMQHQLQSLQQENSSLRNSQGGLEEISGLSRSNTVSGGLFGRRGPPGGKGLARSGSVKNAPVESKEALAERLKDVEAQRDALHNALKNLLERQEFQNRENEKKIRVLEAERQRLLLEPRKAGFDKEISNLRIEINVLRRRAEEALDQKWQVEKGLGGLKMDLDRAEEEIATLRSLLREKDILIPPSLARSPGSPRSPTANGTPATSESLERAYQDLQKAYSESLERIKKLELSTGAATADEKLQLAIQRLEQSLSSAVSERDAAKSHLNGLKSQVEGLAAGESKHIGREKALADELSDSARRVEELASQVQQQLASNAELRKRLSDTVARGDSDRKVNSDRITELQARLHVLEEQIVAAQTASEDRVGRHEEEIAQIREAHNDQLRRINEGAGVGVTARKGNMLNQAASNVFGRNGQPVQPKSLEDESEIQTLRTRVTELERALEDAESEIQAVVAKMSEAQIEVMNLQEERETAARNTRRLQKALEEAKKTPLSASA